MNDEHAAPPQVCAYLTVFAALLVLTVVTVLARNLPVGVAASVAVALLIATAKAVLVGGCFMHLVSEQRAIYALLLFTGAIAAIMMGLIVFSLGTGYEGMGPSPLEALPTAAQTAAGG